MISHLLNLTRLEIAWFLLHPQALELPQVLPHVHKRFESLAYRQRLIVSILLAVCFGGVRPANCIHYNWDKTTRVALNPSLWINKTTLVTRLTGRKNTPTFRTILLCQSALYSHIDKLSPTSIWDWERQLVVLIMLATRKFSIQIIPFSRTILVDSLCKSHLSKLFVHGHEPAWFSL